MPRVARIGVDDPSKSSGSSALSQRVHLESSLSKILSGLAYLLLRNGYGFGVINHLAKNAFVEAARSLEQSDVKAKKVSIATIAAATGLTRVEVARITKSLHSTSKNQIEKQNRALRVAHGWSSDRRFASRSGRAKTLRFTDGQAGFDRLVKRYSGDIPARAMLREMKRLELVKHNDDDTVALVRDKLPPTKATLSALSAIAPWVRQLAATKDIGEAAEFDSSINRFTMHFDSLPQAHAALREIETRKAAFVDALVQLSSKTKTPSAHRIAISVAIASTKPKHARATRRPNAGTR